MKNVCIGETHLKQEPKDVPVEFATLSADMVILSELIVLVYPSHVPIVELHSRGAGDISVATIMLPPLNCG